MCLSAWRLQSMSVLISVVERLQNSEGCGCCTAQASRSRQGKMEKSLLSFAATYPTWEPDAAAKQMLMALGQAPPLRGAPGASADTATMQSAITASLFPGAPRSASTL